MYLNKSKTVKKSSALIAHISLCEQILISFPCSEHAQTSTEQEVATLAVLRIVMVAADWLMRTHPFHFGSSCIFIDESLCVLFSLLHLFFFLCLSSNSTYFLSECRGWIMVMKPQCALNGFDSPAADGFVCLS